ncbi:MAG: hypothetical protein QXG00_01010 [Candidatus Woesearchaeota archaeon]
MKVKHVFVAILDVNELLPFSLKRTKDLSGGIKQQENAKKELVKFIDMLEKLYGQHIYYIGTDIIEAKTYERFIFQKEGFFEVMMEAPLAMNAHFVEEKDAERFLKAIKEVLNKILPNSPIKKIFLESIHVQSEKDQSLTFNMWNTLKEIRNK